MVQLSTNATKKGGRTTVDYMEKINTIIENNGGVVTAKALRDNNIPTVYLSRLVDAGNLMRAARGIYINKDGDYDEYYFLNERYKGIIFSYLSSLYLHNFTDIIPQNMEITVYSGFNAHRIKENVNIHYVNKDLVEMGKIEVETVYGNKVRAYNMEKTICDLIQNKSKVDPELYVTTIRNYAFSKNSDINKLYKYSQKMRITEKVRDTMEILYG
jgi:predicted transcriptional regulator of viral defense system